MQKQYKYTFMSIQCLILFYIILSIFYNSIYITFSGNTKNYSRTIVENNKTKEFKLNFDKTNVFKYDSSDCEEDIHETLNTDEQMADKVEENTCTNSLFEYKDTLFLDNEDIRFNGMYMKNF